MERGGPSRQRTSRRALFVLIALGVSSLATVLLSEAVVRVIAPQPGSWLDFYRRHPELPFFAMQASTHREIDTGETHWSAITDEAGHRIGKTEETVDRALPLMLVLGDSFTFGNGLDYEQSYVGRVARALAGRYRVANAAVGGYGPQQYADTLAYEVKRGARPAVILVGTFLGNDFHDCVWSKDAPVTNGIIGDDGGVRAWVAKNSHLYRAVSKAVHVVFPPPSPSVATDQLSAPDQWSSPFMSEALRKYEQSMARIAAIAAKQRAQLLVAIIPSRSTVDWLRTPAAQRDKTLDGTLPVQNARAVLDRLQIGYVDLTPTLTAHDSSELYFAYDGHLTETGSTIAAAPIVEQLLQPSPAAGQSKLETRSTDRAD